MGRARRTHPSFLSNSEAAREARRTSEIVKSITGIKPVTNIPRKQVEFIEDQPQNKQRVWLSGRVTEKWVKQIASLLTVTVQID